MESESSVSVVPKKIKKERKRKRKRRDEIDGVELKPGSSPVRLAKRTYSVCVLSSDRLDPTVHTCDQSTPSNPDKSDGSARVLWRHKAASLFFFFCV